VHVNMLFVGKLIIYRLHHDIFDNNKSKILTPYLGKYGIRTFHNRHSDLRSLGQMVFGIKVIVIYFPQTKSIFAYCTPWDHHKVDLILHMMLYFHPYWTKHCIHQWQYNRCGLYLHKCCGVYYLMKNRGSSFCQIIVAYIELTQW